MILGLLVGYALEQLSSKSDIFLSKLQWIHQQNWINLLLASMSLLLGGLGIYYGLLVVGLDPEFSVALATKYCKERSWVHPDTTPFYSLMRSTGAVLGMSLVAKLTAGRGTTGDRLRGRGRIDGRTLTGLIFSLLLIFLVHSKYVPSFAESGHVIFYAAAVAKAATIPFVNSILFSILV